MRSFVKENYEYLYEINFEFENEENIQKLIELAVFIRRKSEEEKKYGKSMNSLVKFSNVGQYLDCSDCIDFESTLSKIIHADNIQFEYEDAQCIKSYGYDSDRNSKYTGFVLIEGEKKMKIHIKLKLM